MKGDKWLELAEEHGSALRRSAKNREWKRLHKHWGDKLGLDYDELVAWGRWLIKEYFSVEPTEKSTDIPKSVEWEHDLPYWYDSNRDLYVVHIPSRKRPFAVPGDTWAALREAYSNWDGSPSSVNEIARKFGMARRTVVELLRVMGTTHDSSPWTDEDLLASDEDVLTEDLLRRKEERVLVRAERKEWNRVKKDADSFRRLDLLAQRLALRFENTRQDYDVPKLRNVVRAQTPWVAVISPTDFHWGKYAPENSKDPYNRVIARERLWSRTEELLSRLADRGRPDQIILALGGDGLHIDNQSRTTTRGTPQDCDGTPEELAWSWVEVCRDYVDLVRQLAPVKVMVIPGNHDRYTSTLLRAALTGWFHTIDDVEVEETLDTRQYVVWGDNLLVFLHGDIGKVKDWPAIIAGERSQDWGATKNRFIFTVNTYC